MRRLARVVAALLVVFAGAIAIAVVVLGLWSRAQLKAIVVLAITERTPVAAPLVRLLTNAPGSSEAVVAGRPTSIFRPGEGRGPWRTVVFVNGATRAGRFQPEVRRLAAGLARAGYLVVVPDLPGLRLGQITPRTVDALVRVAGVVAHRRDVRGGELSFYGVSVGASLALLAAESPLLAGRVRAMGGEAPFTSLAKMIRLATTGWYGDARYSTDPYLKLAIARSLAAGLPPGRDRALLVARLDAVPDDATYPLASLRRPFPRLHVGGRALVALLLNRDRRRFSPLYAQLPRRLRDGVAILSPLRRADRIAFPVELASAPHDKYFPPGESEALVRRSHHVRLTITSTLEHAIPKPSFGGLAALLRFDEFVVRFLGAT